MTVTKRCVNTYLRWLKITPSYRTNYTKNLVAHKVDLELQNKYKINDMVQKSENLLMERTQ